MNKKNLTYAILSVLITALISKHFTQIGIESWYHTACKPGIIPPNYIFPIIWNILYILLAYSFYLILNFKKNQLAIRLYVTQLVLQIAWCYFFFAKQYLCVGLVVLIFLNCEALKMIIEFSRIKKSTFYMLLPYNLWIFFALILNAAIASSN